MICPACQTPVPDPAAWECPHCKEHLGQWRELDATAGYLFKEGRLAASQGRHARALLLIAQGVVLDPNNCGGLLSLGELLATVGEREHAEYYLTRCAASATANESALQDRAATVLAALRGNPHVANAATAAAPEAAAAPDAAEAPSTPDAPAEPPPAAQAVPAPVPG